VKKIKRRGAYMRKQMIKPISIKNSFIVLVIALSIVLVPSVVFATSLSDQESMSVLEQGQTVDGLGLFAGTTIRVDGNVEGTAFATGQDVTINGNINGDLFASARTITINGTVSGNIYCAGQFVNINGQSAQDVFAAGQNIIVKNTAAVNRDLSIAGSEIYIDGFVARDLKCGGATVTVSGTIGRDATLASSGIYINDTAVINGDLTYQSDKEASVSTGATILGQLDWQYIDYSVKEYHPSTGMIILGKVLGILGALLVWLFFILWKKDIWRNPAAKIMEKPFPVLGIGALTFIVTPIAAIILMITIIGLPLGILLGIFYAVALYLAKIITAVCLGSWLAKMFKWPEIHKGVWLFLLALVILTLLCMVPYLKTIVWLALAFFGLGAIISVNLRAKKITEEVNTDSVATN
jgi:cytoskeletal protein CcmA (bactofilin family)